MAAWSQHPTWHPSNPRDYVYNVQKKKKKIEKYCIHLKKVFDDEVFTLKLIRLNYYFTLQLPSKLIQYNFYFLINLNYNSLSFIIWGQNLLCSNF